MPVAHQNSAIAQGSNKFRVGRADADEDKIRVARPVMQPEIAEFLLQSLAIAAYLRDIAVTIPDLEEPPAELRERPR